MDSSISDTRRRYAAARKAYSNHSDTDSPRVTRRTNVNEDKQAETQDPAQERNGASAQPTSDADVPSDPETAEAPSGDDTAEADRQTDEELSPEEQIEALKEEQEELNDRLLRQAAEFQNFRRRMQREKKKFFQSGKKEVILPMLEVLDDFQRSIEAAKELQEQEDIEAAYESLKSGVEMVFQKFMDELAGIGVEPIEAEGKPFDEDEHEAMMQQPAPDDVEEGTVLTEIRKGYRLDDQVLRHSRVVVAS